MSIEKAEEFLNAADACLRLGYHNASASRSYYAMFHAAWHSLEAVGVRAKSWSHEGLHAAFAREMIHRRKIFSAHFGSYLTKAIELRIRADYDQTGISARQSRAVAERARELVTRAKEVGRHGES